MPQTHRIFGSELSPYSIKVRSYFRYKNIPHDWLIRNPSNAEEFQQLAKLPLIPLVATPYGQAIQDSTPIMEKIEVEHPEPAIHPANPALWFISCLIEDFGDEWCNKPMFHYRWAYEADQISTSERIAASAFGAEGDALKTAAKTVRERMIPRLSFVGSTPATAGRIEGSFHDIIKICDVHLADRPYILGGRPSFADLGLFAQLYESYTDPTPGAIIRASAPNTQAWIERMLEPTAEGEFEDWATLAPTLTPLLRDQVGKLYLPWIRANRVALKADEASFTVDLDGEAFTQNTQKYHARALTEIENKYAAIEDKSELDQILQACGIRITGD